jgi:hypothetical protein
MLVAKPKGGYSHARTALSRLTDRAWHSFLPCFGCRRADDRHQQVAHHHIVPESSRIRDLHLVACYGKRAGRTRGHAQRPAGNVAVIDALIVGLCILAITPLLSLYTLDIRRLYPSYMIWGRSLVRLALAALFFYLRPRPVVGWNA